MHRGSLAYLAITAALITAVAAADPPLTRRLERQISITEEVLDQILIESPNLLIHGSEPTQGVYIAEFGVIFTIEASLVDKELGGFSALSLLSDLRIERRGDHLVIWDDAEQPDEESPDADEDSSSLTLAELFREDEQDWRAALKERRSRRAHLREGEENRYAAGRQELLEGLLDYGGLLIDLEDDQSVSIAAFFRSGDFLRRKDLSHLIISAKVRDLRAYDADEIPLEEARRRVVIEEY